MRKRSCRTSAAPAFTLLEVVLAIGLTGTLLALLATAIDLYLVRVDANRSKVESAQLARTLLNRIADDIRAVRYYSPDSGEQDGSSNDPNSSSSTGSGSSSSTLDTETSSEVLGIFGTATELRIDRSAAWNWLRTVREIDPTEATPPTEMPQTVGYVFNDGETMLADQLAALGVLSDGSLPGYAGLYRQESPSPAWVYQSSATGVSLSSLAQAEPELLAPEVLTLSFQYFDGNQMLESWDSAQQEGLPIGIEISLTMMVEPFEIAQGTSAQERDAMLTSSKNSEVYRLFVRLPKVQVSENATLAKDAIAESSDQNSGGGGSGFGGSGSGGAGGGSGGQGGSGDGGGR